MRLRTVQGDRYIKLLASALMIVCAVSFAQTAPLSASVAAQSDSRNVGPVFKTTDGGASWAAINSGITAMFVSALAIDPKSTNTLYAGTDRGIFKSTNGGATWTVPNGDITLFTVTSIAVDPVNTSNIYASTYGGGAYKSTDAGATWSRINDGLPVTKRIDEVAIDAVTPSTLYLVADQNIFKSTNGGDAWELALKLPFSEDNLAASARDLELDPVNPSTVYVTGSNKIFKSADGGLNWKDITGPVIFPRRIAIDPSNPSTLYVRNGFEPDGIFKSMDGGATWTSVGNTALTRAGVTQLEVDPRDSSTLYAATGEGLLKSTDGGRDWTNTGLTVSSPFLGSSSVITLAIDPVNPSIIYAGTGGGVSQNDSPWITSVSISGKRLLLTGEAFDDGATILLDGIPQKTVNDAESPTSRLIGNKAGKKVKKNPDLRIQVRNANGRLSQTVLRSVD